MPSSSAFRIAAIESLSSCGPQENCQSPPPMAQEPNPMGVSSMSELPSFFLSIPYFATRPNRCEYRERFARWPTNNVEIPFYHATPHSKNEIFTRLTAEERLSPIFDRATCN